MKKLLLFFTVLFIAWSQFTYGQQTYYSKSTMTTFNTLADWGTNTDGTGSNPGSISTSDNFIVSNNATVTSLGASVSVRNLTINSGSTLSLTSTNTLTSTVASNGVITVNGTLNVNGSVASQINANTLTINNGGIVSNNTSVGSGQPITISGVFTINDGGTYNHNVGRSASIGGSRSFSNNSNFVYTNGGAFGNFTYGNLRWNGAGSLTPNLASLTINGTLRVSSGTMNLQSSTTGSTSIGGGILVDGGTLNGSSGAGVNTITMVNAGLASGDITVSSGTFSPQNITINSSRTVGLANNIAIPSTRILTVNGVLDCGSSVVSGAGAFTLSGTGTLKSGHTSGVNGNITVSGTKTFSSGHKIEWNGTGNQSTGLSGLTITTPATFTVSNTGGTVTLDANVTFGNSASFVTNSNTIFDASTFTLAFGTSPTATIAGTFKTANANGFSGGAATTFTNANTPTFTLTGSTIEYNKGTSQSVTARTDYNKLTLSGAGTKTVSGSNITVGNTLNLSGGNFVLNGCNLTLNGTVTGAGTISGDNLVALTIGGTGSLGTLNFTSGARTLGAFTINRTSSGTVTLGTDLTMDGAVDGTLTLTNGALDASGVTLTFISGNTPIVRTSGTITTNSSTNLVFGTAGNTGGNAFSIPSGTFTSAPSINDLTVNRTNSLTLGQSTTVNGTLTLTAGTLNLGTTTLTIPTNAISRTSGNLDASNGTISFTNTTGRTIPASTFTGNIKNFSTTGTGGVTASDAYTITGTLTVGSSSTLTLGTNTLTGSGGSAAFSGTGIISLDAIGQVSGFSNSFSGTYYLTGTNSSIPAGTYAGITVNGGGATLAGDLVVTGTLSLNGALNVGANTLTISNPIGNTITNLNTSSSSSIVVNGSAANIHIPSTVTALTNLTINSSQLVTADAGITVSGTFTLGGSSFVLDMGANTLEIGTSTSNIGTLTRTTGGSVRGTIKRWLSTATSTLLFPLNNNSLDYVGATVNFSVNPTTGGSLTAKYTSSGAGSIPGGFIDFSNQYPGVNLINLSPQYWTITDNDGLAGFTYGLDLEATNMGINTSTPMIIYTAIVKRNTGGGNTWAWNNSNHVTTNGTGSLPVAHCQGYTTFSDFAIAGNVDNLLPVELSAFTSTVANRDVTLNWSTTEELNNQGFDVERKSTTGAWVKLGSVEGHGTVTTPQSYSFLDRNINSGKYNYRLKQIDYNGNYHYYNLSNEISIGTPSKYVLSQNYPNPFNPVTTISYEIPNGDYVALKVYDLTGKEVASLVNEKQEAGFYSVRFDGAKLSSGVYFYTLKSGGFVVTKKLVLMK